MCSGAVVGRFPGNPVVLLPEVELFEQLLVTRCFGPVKVIEQAPPQRDHTEQPPSGTVVFLVPFEVFRKLVDVVRQERDLHVGRTGVLGVKAMLLGYSCFGLCVHGVKMPRRPRNAQSESPSLNRETLTVGLRVESTKRTRTLPPPPTGRKGYFFGLRLFLLNGSPPSSR